MCTPDSRAVSLSHFVCPSSGHHIVFTYRPQPRVNLMAVIKLTFKLSQDDYEGIVDIADIRYWAAAALIDNTGPDGMYKSYTVKDGESKEPVERKITRAGMERAIVGLFKDRKLNNYYMSAIDQLVLRGCSGDVGSDIADAIVQQAMFGEVIYG